MANEKGPFRASSAPERGPSTPRAPHSGTFPAGVALLSLGVSWVLLRIVLRFMSLPRTRGGPPVVPPVGTSRIAVATGVFGAVLAAVAIFVVLSEPVRERPTPRKWAIAGLRLGFAVPVATLVLASMFDEPAVRLRWWGLFGAGLTVVWSLASGIVQARGLWVARGALSLLLIGQAIELAWPPAHLAAMPNTAWPRLLDRLGSISELATITGALLAAAWAVIAAHRAAGRQRVLMVAPFPVITSVLLTMLMLSVPKRVVGDIAHGLWGVRFDLLASANHPLALSRAELLLYLLVPQALLVAGTISFAAAGHDRGASVRRGLGWLAVLLGGFGALTLSAPMDPTRLVTVTLAAVLLERAVVMEAEDRAAK